MRRKNMLSGIVGGLLAFCLVFSMACGAEAWGWPSARGVETAGMNGRLAAIGGVVGREMATGAAVLVGTPAAACVGLISYGGGKLIRWIFY